MSEKLLPNSAGPFTHALAVAWDTEGRYGHLAGTIKDYGITITPDDWVPWFIYDLGLEDVIPYVRTYRQVLAEGPAWLATRGTPAAISIGIGWVESSGEVAPPDGRHNWWEFQVSFDEPPKDLAQLRQLFGIINLSKASEDELFRMYSPGYDFRPVRMDEHRFDDGWFDDYSGQERWEGGPIISFGRDETGVTEFGIEAFGAAMFTSTRVVSLFDGERFDEIVADETRPSPIWLVAQQLDGSSFRDGGEIEVIPSDGRRDSASLFAEYSEDVWPDTYPIGSTWRAATLSHPVPTKAETT